MAQINLLPWRDRLREERRREFLTILVGFVIIAGGLIFLVDQYFNRLIDLQTARNNFLGAEIEQLDAQVAEINELRQQKEDIRSRMNVITDLQGTRPVIVRIFDELVRTLPEGVYYETVTRTDNSISIEGIAESPARITELMRNLDASEWFADTVLPDFSVIESQESVLSQQMRFRLITNIELPGQNEDQQV